MEHPVLVRIRRESFTPLGWFEPQSEDLLPGSTQFVILIGNTGTEMFRRFSRERNDQKSLMDEWTKSVVDSMAQDLDAQAVYPFDKPPRPFLSWARRASAGHVSPLGLNIHPTYGLWHAYRAALLFPVAFDFPKLTPGKHPCETCKGRPCLKTCPVSAFEPRNYKVGACTDHLQSEAGTQCLDGGCMARLACPVGQKFTYSQSQLQFHMKAFLKARTENPDELRKTKSAN